MHFASADATSIQDAQELCSSADYDEFSKPLVQHPPLKAVLRKSRHRRTRKWILMQFLSMCLYARMNDPPQTFCLLEHLRVRKAPLAIPRGQFDRRNRKEQGHWSTGARHTTPSTLSLQHQHHCDCGHQIGTPDALHADGDLHSNMLDKNFRLLSALPVGTTFFATQQMSGRGRGRQPVDLAQRLSAVLAVFPRARTHGEQDRLPPVPVRLAVVEGIRIALGDTAAGRAVADKVRIKWPNDIYAEIPPVDETEAGGRAKTATFELDGKRYAKLGGILVNSQFSGGNEFVLIPDAGSTVLILVRRRLSRISSRSTTNKSRPLVGESSCLKYRRRNWQGDPSTFDSIWKTFMQHQGDFRPFVERYRQVWAA